MLNQGIGAQPLHSMQPMPAERQPSFTLAMVSSVAEDLVQVAHRADVGIAGIVQPHARRVGHHGLQLLPHHRLGVSQQDGVAVRLRHLAAVGAGQLRRLESAAAAVREKRAPCLP